MTPIMRTAGLTNGTPDWQLDNLYESESDRIWEEGSYDTQCALMDAWFASTDVCDHLADAAHIAEGKPVEARILSIIDSLELLQKEIHQLAEELERGRK